MTLWTPSWSWLCEHPINTSNLQTCIEIHHYRIKLKNCQLWPAYNKLYKEQVVKSIPSSQTFSFWLDLYFHNFLGWRAAPLNELLIVWRALCPSLVLYGSWYQAIAINLCCLWLLMGPMHCPDQRSNPIPYILRRYNHLRWRFLGLMHYLLCTIG